VDQRSKAPGPAPDAAPQRAELLGLAAKAMNAAWSSFDRARPRESVLDEDLLGRLAGALPEDGGDPADAIEDAARVLDASISPARPLNLAYVGSTGLATATVGDALAATYDVNLAAHSAAAAILEAQTSRWTAEFIGHPRACGGFTSGGQISNLSAILAARERAMPGSRVSGVSAQAGALYCSGEAHQSIIRAAEVAGLGSESVRRLPIDSERRLVPEALERALEQDLAAGVNPVAVIATAGTTLTGAVDPIADLVAICERRSVWLHVDGAYGLPAAATPSAAPLFAGIDRVDSATLDAHKWLGVPKSCSVLLVQDEEVLQAAFGHREKYLLHREDAPNPVDHTLEYSRPMRSLKLWLVFRVHGAAALRVWIQRGIDNARLFTSLIDADPAFQMLHRPMLSTVCFRHTPPGVADLDAHNLRLARAIQADGRVYLAPATIDDRACLRGCFVNFRTTPEDVRLAVAVARELGELLA